MPDGCELQRPNSVISLRCIGSSTGQPINVPASTIDTTDRLGLVMVKGAEYVITDILLRVLRPREFFNAHGLPANYVIDRDGEGRFFTQREHVSMVGNSVPPPVAAAIVRAYLNLASEARAA